MSGDLLAVFGTRPEAIKMCPLILKLRQAGLSVKVILSGQHGDAVSEILSLFSLRAEEVLEIQRKDGSLSELTSLLIEEITNKLTRLRPSAVLVHGDTTTAFCAALAGFYLNIDVIHIEAGLRSRDVKNPFPEEINRIFISKIAALHFAPTDRAKRNLLSEGVAEDKIFTVGNTVIDSFKYTLKPDYAPPFNISMHSKIILLTAHRRESLDGAIFDTLMGVRDALLKVSGVFLIFPVHKNPRASQAANSVFSDVPGVILCEPLSVYHFHNLLKICSFVITDSGGVQEEAAYLGKPVIVTRDVTERDEAGATPIITVGRKREAVRAAVLELLQNPELLTKLSSPTLAFGDGHASERISDVLRGFYKIC